MEDLLQLALYKKIGRAQKEARPPASFGSELPRCGKHNVSLVWLDCGWNFY